MAKHRAFHIKEIAASIAGAVGEEGKVYRIGGDEFVAILECTDDDKVKSIIAKYNSIIDDKNKNRYDGINISAAVGKAFGEGHDIEDIVKRADTDMYRQKNKYKNARL